MPDTFQSAVDKRLVPKAVTFDPDSAGYDDDTFNASGQKRDPINNHASSLDPRTGMVLKGRNHPTFGWTINAEAELGNTIVKAKDGRYYSRSKDKLAEGDEPIKLTEQEQQKAREAAATKVMEQGGKPNTFQSAIEEKLTAPQPARDYGKRNDGTKKGDGWLGPIDLGNGDVATEFTTQSQAVQVNGKQIDFPTLVPTLTPEEVETMKDVIRFNKEIPKKIMQKAVDHAKKQLSEGRPVYISYKLPS